MIDHIDTGKNPLGLCSINYDDSVNTIIAYPSKKDGQICIILYGEENKEIKI